MIIEVIQFYWKLVHQVVWQPSWLLSEIPDKSHFHRRRFTESYQKKRRFVRGLWFSAVLMMLAFPVAHLVVFIALFTTFISFSILDETSD